MEFSIRNLVKVGVLIVVSSLLSNASSIDISKGYHIATVVGESTTYNNYRYYKRPIRYKKVRYVKYPVYKKVVRKKHYKKRKKYYRVPKVRHVSPVITNDMRIQKALKSLGFYSGKIDGAVQSYETRLAIKKMHKEYKGTNSAILDPKEKDTIIYLGTLFDLDRALISKGADQKSHFKRIQAALKVLGFYQGKVDGISGRGTRAAIIEYKESKNLSSNPNLSFKQEEQLLNEAKTENDTNIDEAVGSLKAESGEAIME